VQYQRGCHCGKIALEWRGELNAAMSWQLLSVFARNRRCILESAILFRNQLHAQKVK
jgi:hypothetical protein